MHVCVNVCVVIIISKLETSKAQLAKRMAPAYSRAVHQIRGVVQRLVQERFWSGCQRVKGDRVAVSFRARVGLHGKTEDWKSQVSDKTEVDLIWDFRQWTDLMMGGI